MSSDINIYDIPLYYISFNKNTNLEKDLKNVGFKNINMFEAINGEKMNILNLRKNNIISIRTYNDLLNGRNEHSGIPGLGAIGCSLSHYYLWKKCIDENLDFITIIEDDLKIANITQKDIENIQNIITKDKGLFISSKNPITDSIYEFNGTHFYIASNSACKELIKYMFPIDTQVDFYMSHLKNIGYINLEGYPILSQKIHFSSIQDVCIKCYLPKNILFYIIIFVLIIILIIIYCVKNKM